MSAIRCPHCGGVLSAYRLSGRERSELAYLMKNPGIWGGPLDRGQKHEDPIFEQWEKEGLVEAKRRNGHWGYYITAIGRAALEGGAE